MDQQTKEKKEDSPPIIITTTTISDESKTVTVDVVPVNDIVIVNENKKLVRGVEFPIVSSVDKLQNAVNRQRVSNEDIAELSRIVQRDCHGRTFADIEKVAKSSFNRLSSSAQIVLNIYLEKISKVTALEIAIGQMMVVDLGFKSKFECPTVSLGCSNKFPVEYTQTSGMVLCNEVDALQQYLLYKLRELFKDQPTDVLVEKINPYYFDWGFTYVTVFIVNTTFIPNKYTPQNLEKQLLKTQYIVPLVKNDAK